MGFLFTSVFWGVILIFWGVSLIIEKIFKIKIPIMRFLLAFIIIYAGIHLLLFRGCSSNSRTNIISKSQPKVMVVSKRVNNTNIDMNEYSSVFASNIIDLTTYKDYEKGVVINTVFGSSEVKISSEEAYNFNVNSVFGGVILPENYKTGDGSTDQNVIFIDINSVFGSTTVSMNEVETTQATQRVIQIDIDEEKEQ